MYCIGLLFLNLLPRVAYGLDLVKGVNVRIYGVFAFIWSASVKWATLTIATSNKGVGINGLQSQQLCEGRVTTDYQLASENRMTCCANT